MRTTTNLAFSALVCWVAVVAALPAWAAPFDLQTNLTASDAATGNLFGWSVAISRTRALVGAHMNDSGGGDAGAAYLFDVTNGEQRVRLTASDAAEGDQFGRSVAIGGDTALVGAAGNDDAGANSGSAYLFNSVTGGPRFKLTADDAAEGDAFGNSVAIDGTTALVGATFDDDGGAQSGSAYLFDVATGNELFKLTASDAAAADQFGKSVAINGNRALVGASLDDHTESNAGSAYLFDVATGDELFKLTADDAAATDLFGASVAISGNTAIVGALGDDDAGANSGSAYLFDVNTGEQLFKLNAKDAGEGDKFGESVAISGRLVLVGASGDDDGGSSTGSAYVFDAETGDQLFKFTITGGAANNAFGFSVAISDNTALIGSWGSDSGGANSGTAHLLSNSANLVGDYNGNGVVDAADYSLWRDNLGGDPLTTFSLGSRDRDNFGPISEADYDSWKANFGNTRTPANDPPPAASAVPEPAAWLLLLGGASLLALARRRD